MDDHLHALALSAAVGKRSAAASKCEEHKTPNVAPAPLRRTGQAEAAGGELPLPGASCVRACVARQINLTGL